MWKRPLRGSVPNFKTKALAVRKLKGKQNCENEHREKASFMYNFVQKTNATKQLWWHFISTSPLIFSHGFHQKIRFKRNFKVARNEVKNASFAQRSAHRDSRIWRPELIEPAAERKLRARADDDRRSNRPTPTHRFCHSAIFRPITPYNVWFFWISRHRSIILAKKLETFSGRFWEIPGNVLKLELWKC